ncbi:MAG TPA: TonB-dependent receptor [Oligoflexus sp.]|uniref:TonB-dependent receptor plug domain-containing protein n=1 Tax=Oligoflexus sp. TaxID=1971216 RepID=UPI002D6CDD2D|nr:TonB-dependent receptor [Oligoflexus sp.]HYX33313.1 TonB-dependent receptor [Oligoflexus sp.]
MKQRIVPMAIVLLELGATQAKAQTPETRPTEAAVTDPEAKKKTERIEVTGSRIRRIDVETSAPVQVIDKKEIQQSGVVSLGDLFRKSASSSPTGNFSGSSEYVSAGAATLDLLGLGSSRTLVLLNGKRMPTIGGVDAVNIDNIPVAIIDRIDILSGGASAIYGADAVGGVVNIITRKEFQGTEASFFKSFTQHEGGDELEMSIAQGVQLGADGTAILSAGYRKRNRIEKRNRDLEFSSPERANTVSRQPVGTWSYQPITITAAGADFGDWSPSPNCPPERQIATVPTEPNNVYCTGQRKEAFVELIPEKNDWYAAATATYTLPSDWTISGLLSYASSKNEANDGRFLPYAVDPISNAPILLSPARAQELGVVPAGTAGDFFYVYAPMPNFPERIYINTFNTLTAATYLDGDVGEWKASAGLSFAASESIREGKKIFNREEMSSIFVNPDPTSDGADPAYIPLDPNRDESLLMNTFTDLKSQLDNKSSSADVFFSKDMMDLPGGKFALGLGGAFAAESFKLNPDELDTQFDSTNRPLYAGTFADRGEGDRTISSVYAEFVAPVVKDVNVEGALRFDHYSDFDSTANFGLGAKASLTSFLGVRGRAASSFTAPQLSALHQIGGGGYYSVTDEKWCARENAAGRTCEITNPSRQVYVDQPGNKELKPEVGLNYIAGIILDPVPGLSLVSDYYWVNLKKTFATDQIQEIVDAWYEANPTATAGGTIKENPVEVDTDGVITKVGLPIRNLGKLEVRAVDTKLNYSTTAGGLRLGLDSQYFRMLSYKVQEVQDKPIRDQVGYFGVPAWRWNNKATVSTKIQDFTLASRTIAPQSQDPETADDDSRESKAGVYTEYDFVYGIDLPWNGTFQLGVNNIFDTIGGKVDGNSLRSEDIASSSLYSYVGRAYYARITQRL